MNKRDYRPGRVRVSAKIENEIFRLVVEEQDIKKKKKHPASWYRNKVAERLKLQEKDNPSLRSYEEKLRKIRLKLRSLEPHEPPWCIGHCFEHGISGNVIPLLIRLKKKLGDRLTIRRAKWLSLLYPAIEELVREQYPDDPDKQDIRYAFISREYAVRELLCSALGREFDTSDLDTLFFIYRDISKEAVYDAISDNIFYKIPQRRVGEFSPDDIAELEARLGKLTQRELDILHGYEKAMAVGNINARIYMHEHSEEMQPLIEKTKRAEPNKEESRDEG